MRVKDLLKLIPDEILETLSAETKVDYQVKKLHGSTMFKLFMFSLLQSTKPSLRIMEHIFESMQFRMVAGLTNETTKFNSISDRLATMNYVYFEKIFHFTFYTFNKLFKEEKAIQRYDSTMIAMSSVLVEWGMHVGSKTDKVQLKYTIGMKGSFPCHVKIFDTQDALAEDNTIPLAILENSVSKTSIIVFDRGVKSRKTFGQFTKEDRLFVTRLNTDASYKVIKKLRIPKEDDKNSVIILEYLIVNLKIKTKWDTAKYRLVRAIIKESGELIYFITNSTKLSAYQIAFCYKQRWDIEPFFKFLKQHLNLNHLVSRNDNGRKVMIYMTLIIAILIIAYKKLNKISSLKIAKFLFCQALEAMIIEHIIILSGGDFEKVKHLFNDS
jgi:hypothetical protein